MRVVLCCQVTTRASYVGVRVWVCEWAGAVTVRTGSMFLCCPLCIPAPQTEHRLWVLATVSASHGGLELSLETVTAVDM